MSGTVFPQGRIIAANGDFAAPWRMFMQNLYKATSGGASTALIPGTRTINGHALSADISLLATDVGAPSGSGTSTGTNTGDQTITLTGDVTGSGTGSFAATVGKIGGQVVSLAGSLTTAGAFASTFTMTGVTALTFPTAGTLATLAGVEAMSNKAITSSAVDGTPIGATTPSTGNFSTVESTGYVKSASTTVASLPAAATGAGTRHFVTDATATTFLSIVAGGGANKVPVVSDGTNWLIG